MTPVQAKVLDYYRERITRGGFVPFQTDAAKHFGVSVPRIGTILKQLERGGFLVRHHGQQRGIELAGAVSLVAVPTEQLRAELARRGETLDALDGGERRRLGGERRAYGAGTGICAADGCGLTVSQGDLMCLRHWRSLPERLRISILRAHDRAWQTGRAEDKATFGELVRQARELIGDGRVTRVLERVE